MKSIFFEKKFYQRRRSNYSDVVEIENNIEKFRFYEIEKLMIKRFRKYRNTQMTQYLIRWIDYEPEYNEWKSISTLNNNLDLIKKYEIAHSEERRSISIRKKHATVVVAIATADAFSSARGRDRPRKKIAES